MNENLEKYQLENTRGVLVVSFEEFAAAIIRHFKDVNVMFNVGEFDKYYVLKGNDPKVKFGYYYTLLLDKNECSWDEIMYEVLWQMNEIHKEEKKKILNKLKEEFDVEDENN